MKTANCIFTTIALGALTLGFAGETAPPGHTSPSREEPARPDVKHLANQQDQGPPRKGSLIRKAPITTRRHLGLKPPHPLQSHGARPGAKRIISALAKKRSEGSITGLAQSAMNKTAGAASAGSKIKSAENHRSPSVADRSSPLPTNPAIRRRGPGPGILGGVSNSNIRNAGILNGTGMKPKP